VSIASTSKKVRIGFFSLPRALNGRAIARITVNLFGKSSRPEIQKIFVLVRFWQEDGVWNASALDISVAVFGDTFEDARNNFEQAMIAHFEILVEMNKVKGTIKKLVQAAQKRGFYDRIRPRETFEKFPVRTDERELCLI
jgi:predicted RNase H-like HicB family nuclease